MKTLRAIIIDDEQKGISSLKLLIEKYIQEVRVVAESTDPFKGIELIETYRPEIVFLDINMPHLNGFEMLEKLSYREFSLIFTTAHSEYGLKALKNNALEYLLKPIDHEDLEKAVEKARQKNRKISLPDLSHLMRELTSIESDKVPLHLKDKVEYLTKNDIIRLESDSNYTYIHTADNKKIVVAKTIGDFEQQLCGPGSNFMRVHQSHIINLNHVRKFTKESGGIIFTDNNSQVPLSKTKKEEFMKWLGV